MPQGRRAEAAEASGRRAPVEPDRASPSPDPATVEHEPSERPRRPWRQLIAAAAVGAILGAAIPGGIQLAERAASTAERDGIAQQVADYLDAIAEGRGDDATAMVPVDDAALLGDEALSAAAPITDQRVLHVWVDGDEARVEAQYRLGPTSIQRTLRVVRDAGEWRVRTSLAEPLLLPSTGIPRPTIGGIRLDELQVLRLYPGSYTTEAVDDGLLRTPETTIDVDGREETPTEAFLQATFSAEVEAEAIAAGTAHLEACAAAGECGYEQGDRVEVLRSLSASGDSQLLPGEPTALPVSGFLEVRLDRSDATGVQIEPRQLPIRLFEAEGGGRSWQCAAASSQEPDWEACRA